MSRPSGISNLLLGLSLGITTTAAAADEKLVLVGGERHSGQVTSLADGELKVDKSDNGSQTFAAGEWLRWGHPVEPPPRVRLHFGNHSLLVARQDWTGKVPIVVAGDEIVIDNAVLGKTSLRRSDVRCILLDAASELATAQRLLSEADTASFDDRVWLVEGDLLRGRVVEFDGTKLQLELGGETLPLLANRIAAIAFAGGESTAPAAEVRYLVGFDDGSLVEAASVTLDEEQLAVTWAGGGEWQTPDVERLAFLQSLAPTIDYLSDLEPVDYKHTPYFTGTWPLARDRSLAGGPLAAGGRRNAKGLAMHSASRAVYRVPSQRARFCADIALDDTAGTQGSVVYRVYCLTSEGLEPAYESPVVRGGEEPRRVNVDVAGASAVVLVADYADRGDELDRANWLDARFVP